MKTAGELLRKARISQDRTIEDVAAASRINQKFLEEIENGKLPNVPVTYVRAFLRDFALEVGIDPEIVFEEIRKDPELSSILNLNELPHSAGTNVAARIAPSVHTELRKKKKNHQFQIVVVIAVFIFTGLALSIFFFRQPKVPTGVKEISFNDMLKDKESKSVSVVPMPESLRHNQLKSGITVPDSIILEGVAAESVWVRITSDGVHISETIIPPFVRKRWQAKKEFLISLGNGAAMSFTFNGQKIGAFSATRKPIKNLILSNETLEKLKKTGN